MVFMVANTVQRALTTHMDSMEARTATILFPIHMPLMPQSFTISMAIIEGSFNSNKYDPDSVSNPYGRYGSKYYSDSINNPYGAGNPYSADIISIYGE